MGGRERQARKWMGGEGGGGGGRVVGAAAVTITVGM